MKKKRPSIKDIASELNVSVTTVSFVLNGKAQEMRISEEVTRKILSYAEEVKYTPNRIAQSLRTGKTNIIVFMVEDISNPFFAKLARIIEIIAYTKGYKVIFCSNENDDKKTAEILQVFKDRKVDGYIIIPSAGIEKEIKLLVEDDMPVILFDRYFPNLSTNYVVINNKKSTYEATKHLINNSYRNIGFVTISARQTQMQDRLKGYKQAIRENSLKSSILELPFVDNKTDDEYMLKTFFEKNPQLDSIFFATNYLTQRGLLVIKEHFPSKMEEWGIMTFDDTEFFKIHTPSISAVAQPLELIGQKLMEIMLNLLSQDKPGKFQKIVLDASLMLRESSKPKSVKTKYI